MLFDITTLSVAMAVLRFFSVVAAAKDMLPRTLSQPSLVLVDKMENEKVTTVTIRSTATVKPTLNAPSQSASAPAPQLPTINADTSTIAAISVTIPTGMISTAVISVSPITT